MDHISLRAALETDCEFFFEVRNHPENRINSTNHDPLSYDSHINWFQRKVSDPTHNYFIILYDLQPAGYLRLDSNASEQKEISIALLPKFQGKKIGSTALKLATELSDKPLLAFVKENNIPSQKVFLNAGFKLLPEKKLDLLSFMYQ